MKRRDAPKLDPRRTQDFAAELSARARAWIPSWALDDGEGDFARALLQVAARFDGEVAERLDGAGEKLRDGLFDWLGAHGEAARPARVPVAFKLGDKARDPVLARAPVRLTTDVDGASVVFETESDVQLVPAKLECLVCVEDDKIYMPPPGLASLEPQTPVPTQWLLKSFAAPGATKLQLDPAEGLVKDIVLVCNGQRFRIVSPDKGLVTIAPPLRVGLPQGAEVRKVEDFPAYDGQWIDEQAHILYLGSTDLFDIEAEATLDIVGAQGLVDIAWAYWGKRKDSQTPDIIDWQPLRVAKVQSRPDALILEKPKGAVELLEIDGKSSRWIRGVVSQVSNVRLAVESLGVRVNYEGRNKSCQALAGTPLVTVEAMANTTPLVLSEPFHPLGREPRQFDAFYLGSAEAFSKPGADVQLCFEMADLSFQALACLRTGTNANKRLAGITRDGGLQLLSFEGGTLARYDGRAPLHPPSPGSLGAVVNEPPITLRQGTMAIWNQGDDLLVAATADNAVWVWREESDPHQSGWKGLPDVPFVPSQPGQEVPPIDDLVYVPGPGLLLALRDGALHACNPDSDATWTDLDAVDSGGDTVVLARIAPILVDHINPTRTERVVGVATDGTVYALTLAVLPLSADCELLMTGADSLVAPAAILRSDDKLVAVACTPQPGPKLQGSLSPAGGVLKEVAFEMLDRIEPFGIDAAVAGGDSVFAASVIDADGVTRLARWSPFESAVLDELLFTTPIPSHLGPAGGVPVVLPAHVVMPALSSRILVANFDPKRCLERQAPLQTAILTATGDPLQDTDSVAFPVSTAPGGYEIKPAMLPYKEKGGARLFAYDVVADAGGVIVYPAGPPDGSQQATAQLKKVTVAAGSVTPDQTRLLITTTPGSTATYLVKSLAGNTATLDRALDAVSGDLVEYWLPAPAPVNNRRIAPLLALDGTVNFDWDAALLDRVPLAFPDANPTWQRAHAFDTDGNEHALSVDLASPWTVKPPLAAGKATFLIDAALEPWSGQLADTTSNPALSWEYWNGAGWWSLNAVDASTQNLKRSGSVKFKVPNDLRATDWSGKTSHWIRARLVGGDYGREKVTVFTSQTDDPKVTKQTFDRDPSIIRAPYVASLRVTYALPTPVLPTYVLAQDSGTTRDQSDANRTPQAIVEAFVPLPVALGRLSTPATRTDDEAESCPPPCACGGASTAASSSTKQTSTAASQVVLSGGRALFLGFSGALAGQPVRLFLRVQESAMQDPRSAVRIEALVADRFVPLFTEDATRSLSESGMLTLAFDDAPTPRELFGKPLRWLRVTPPDTMSGTWAPVLQGVYINASWATAAETLRYERLGSSIGAPTLVLGLARPPVLRNTLELRVREPLGDEEREALLEGHPRRVVSNLADLPGDWVRWDQVFDPADEDASRRAYALDEATGEIVFGDGEHGMIPPIGQDNIVAFRYQRSERATDDSERVPANAVALRAKLNLASPVAGVEAVFAADQAAGGAPPEAPARILRFGGARVRHRNRAVTLADLEDIALQTSPAIAQARCFPTPGGVRLVVAMRGDPQPTAAQRRELLRALLPIAPVGLAAPRALCIEGPTRRALDVALQLQVDSLDDAGMVAQSVRTRLAALFDPVAGDAHGEGWPMGRSPDESDIALVLVDTPRLRGVPSIVLHEVQDAGRRGAWPAKIRASDLIVLRDDAVHFEFATSEASA